MESLTRLVSESFARHGFDRPLDYRQLHWSHWFPCESPRSLLLVPSKPGVFAVAEEIMSFGTESRAWKNVGTAAFGCPAEQGSAQTVWDRVSEPVQPSKARLDFAGSTHVAAPRRMLGVLQFCEDDDMAFVLDRMFSRQNPMRARLASGRCFVRFVVLKDQSQRRYICNALNQWLISSSEATTGIGAHFASSLELTDASTAPQSSPARAGAIKTAEETNIRQSPQPAAPQPDSGAAANIHCPSPFPSGF